MAQKLETKRCGSWLPKAKYDQYGREIPDPDRPELPTDVFEAVSSMDMKMQFLLQEMMNRLQKPALETVEDDVDFDLPDEVIKTKYNDFATKEDFNNVKKEVERVKKLSQQQNKKQTDDEKPVVRKAAKPARAQRVEVDTETQNSELADE